MQEEKKTKHKGLHISKVVLLSILKIGIPVVIGVIIFVELISIIEKKNIQASENVAIEEDELIEEETTTTYVENPLLQDEYPEVNAFFEEYYTALAEGDTDSISNLQDFLSDTDKITIEKKAEYIEAYENLSCYTKNGINEGDYFVFAVTDVKFYNVEATAPAMTVYYLYKNQTGTYQIEGEMDDDVLEVLSEVYDDEEVTDLFNKIDVSYTEAVATDESLNAFLTELPSLLKTEVGEALALLESSDTTEISDEEVAASEVATEVLASGSDEVESVIQVVALDTVNVRKSDSSEADKIGKVSQGEVLTCLEQKINGWSRVLYNGEEGYIKSTYLETITSAADGEVIGTVTANSNVNVRSQASQDSSKLGVASSGTVYNLLEDLGEWYRIDYNGNNGYVKAEYFTK